MQFAFDSRGHLCRTNQLCGESVLAHIRKGSLGIHCQGSESLLDSTDKFLYLHSKGVTHKPQFADDEGKNIYFWRTYMEYYLVRHHQRCLDILEAYDTVGVDLFIPGGSIYAGNFWWSRADFFLLHPTSIGAGYYDPEHYLLNQQGVNMSRVYSMAQSDMVKAMQSGANDAHYQQAYPPSKYVDQTSAQM